MRRRCRTVVPTILTQSAANQAPTGFLCVPMEFVVKNAGACRIWGSPLGTLIWRGQAPDTSQDQALWLVECKGY